MFVHFNLKWSVIEWSSEIKTIWKWSRKCFCCFVAFWCFICSTFETKRFRPNEIRQGKWATTKRKTKTDAASLAAVVNIKGYELLGPNPFHHIMACVRSNKCQLKYNLHWLIKMPFSLWVLCVYALRTLAVWWFMWRINKNLLKNCVWWIDLFCRIVTNDYWLDVTVRQAVRLNSIFPLLNFDYVWVCSLTNNQEEKKDFFWPSTIG